MRRHLPVRSQSGITLIEVVLATAILSVIFIPILAWSTLVVDRQTQPDGTGPASLALISMNLKRDVPSASAVLSGDEVAVYSSCASVPSGFDPTQARVRLVVELQESPLAKVEYVERTKDGVVSLWRHKCTATLVGGLVTGWTEVAGGALELVGSLDPLSDGSFFRVDCEPRVDNTGSTDDCGLVTVNVQGEGGTVSVTQEVRYDSGAAAEEELEGSEGIPIVRITSTPATTTGFRPFTVNFSSADSENVVGAQFFWEVVPQQGLSSSDYNCTDPAAGDLLCTFTPSVFPSSERARYKVRLTVTKTVPGPPQQTYVRTASRIVEVRNSRPSAVITSPSESDEIFRRVPVSFDGSASFDLDAPNGDVTELKWDVDGDGQDDPQYDNQETFQHTYPADFIPAGQLQRTVNVRLTARDADGGVDEEVRQITVRNAPPVLAVTPPEVLLSSFDEEAVLSVAPAADGPTCTAPTPGTDPPGSCDLDGRIVRYEVDFGDNSAPLLVEAGTGGFTTTQLNSLRNIRKVYPTANDANGNPITTYELLVRATDELGAQTVRTAIVTINLRPRMVVAASAVTAPASTPSATASPLVVNGELRGGTTAVSATNTASVVLDAFNPSGVQSPCPSPLPNPLTTSCDPETGINSLRWTWSDNLGGQNGPVATASTHTRQFTAPGLYTVTLTGTDAAGATGTTTRQVKINSPPTATGIQPGAQTVPAIESAVNPALPAGQVYRRLGLPLTASGVADTDAPSGAPAVTCSWSVTQAGSTTTLGSGACANPVQWVPTQLGTHTLNLTLLDSEGGRRELTRSVDVVNRRPILRIIPDPRPAPQTPFVVNDGSVFVIGCGNSTDPDADPDAPPMRCRWTWGDGSPVEELPFSDNASHVYNRNSASCQGTTRRTCSLSVTLIDSDGGTTTLANQPVKLNLAPSVTSFSVSPAVQTTPNANGEFVFTATAALNDVDGFVAGVTYRCEERQGGDPTAPWVLVSSSEEFKQNPAPGTEPPSWTPPSFQCRYTTGGQKRVIVRFFDNDERVAESNPAQGEARANLRPIARIRIDSPTTLDPDGKPVVKLPPYSVDYSDGGSFDPENSGPLTYSWRWQDGVAPQTGVNPPARTTFSNAGEYTLTLTVTDAEGLASLPVSTTVRLNRPPVAQGSYRSTGCGALPVERALAPTSPERRVCRGIPVTFDAASALLDSGRSSDLDSPVVNGSRIATYRWNIQTSVTNNNFTLYETAVPPPITWTPSTAQLSSGFTRTVQLSVVDTDGLETAVQTFLIRVVDAPPVAVISTSPSTNRTDPVTGEQIVYKRWDDGAANPTDNWLNLGLSGAGSFDPDGAPLPNDTTLRYRWSTGDGAADKVGTVAGELIATAHSYTRAGRFTLGLTVTDPANVTDSATRLVVINKPPTAAIAPVTTPRNPGAITLDGTGSVDPAQDNDAPSLTYAWTFRNQSGAVIGTAATVQPTFTPPSPGTYTVELVVTDKYGEASPLVSRSIRVNAGPTANIAGQPRIVLNPNYTVTFDSAGTTDDDGPAGLVYRWDFGDGTPVVTGPAGTNTTATKTFAAPPANFVGPFVRTVTLTVTDSLGLTSTDTVDVKLNRAPVPAIAPINGVERGFPVTFSGAATTDPDIESGQTLQYAWTVLSGTTTVATLTGQTPSYTFTATGQFTVRLTVTDGDGLAASAERTVDVVNRPPTAEIINSVPGGNPVFKVDDGQPLLTSWGGNNSTSPYDAPLEYRWEFGDGTVVDFSPAFGVDHIYTGAGRYTARLVVRDTSTGLTDDDTRLVVINRRPIAQITASADYINEAPGTVSFSGLGSSDPAPDGADASCPPNGICSYAWDLDGDGQTDDSILAEPTFTYLQAGAYLVRLNVTDKYGTTGTTTKLIRVNTPPIAVIDDPDSPPGASDGRRVLNPPYQTTFNGASSLDDLGPANLTYQWDFTDDGTFDATGSTATHQYPASLAGTTVTVRLRVQDQFGESGEATQRVKINARPNAVIGPETIRAKQGFPTPFTGGSSTDPDGDPTRLTFAWNFGDPGSGTANTSTLRNPSKTYAALGTYTVTLTVTDEDGLSSTSVTREITVTVNQPPLARIIVPDGPIYRNAPVTLRATPAGSTTTTCVSPLPTPLLTSCDPDGTLAGFTWTLPGPTTQTAQVITPSFTQLGANQVSLQVRDDNNALSAVETVTLQVVIKDLDGDGFEDAANGGTDCDDSRNDVFPGAPDPLDAARFDSSCDDYDGVVAQQIFVRQGGVDDTTAPELGGCGSPSNPCGDLAAAVEKGKLLGRPTILVAAGTYDRFTVSGAGVTVRGGYTSSFDRRGTVPSGSRTTTVQGAAGTATGLGVYATAGVVVTNLTSPTEIRDLDVRGGNASGSGEASYGLVVRQSGNLLTVRDTVVSSGRGSAGLPGNQGANAPTTPAARGGDGVNSRVYDVQCNIQRSPGGSAADASAGEGGAGGSVDTGCGGIPNFTSTSGLSGGAGNPSGSSCGLGGPGGGRSDGQPGAGGPGLTGCNGQSGSAGAGGQGGATQAGTISGGLWTASIASTGGTGAAGTRGGGGGGGGGGGATDNCGGFLCLFPNNPDSRGAGGGGGGAGGATAVSAGAGGRTGGASIAVLLDAAQPTFTGVTVTAGTGGNGGTGGRGAQGQIGGNGGAGGRGNCNSSAPDVGPCTTVSGNGGGAGGPSVGIWAVNGGNQPTATVVLPSAGAAGGAGGTAAAALYPGAPVGLPGANGATGLLQSRVGP